MIVSSKDPQEIILGNQQQGPAQVQEGGLNLSIEQIKQMIVFYENTQQLNQTIFNCKLLLDIVPNDQFVVSTKIKTIDKIIEYVKDYFKLNDYFNVKNGCHLVLFISPEESRALEYLKNIPQVTEDSILTNALKTLKKAPKNVILLLSIAELYIAKGELAEAQKYIDQVKTSLDPKDSKYEMNKVALEDTIKNLELKEKGMSLKASKGDEKKE